MGITGGAEESTAEIAGSREPNSFLITLGEIVCVRRSYSHRKISSLPTRLRREVEQELLSGIFFRLLSPESIECTQVTIHIGRIVDLYGMLLLEAMTVLRQMTTGGHANYGLRCNNFRLISGQNSEPRFDSRSKPS